MGQTTPRDNPWDILKQHPDIPYKIPPLPCDNHHLLQELPLCGGACPPAFPWLGNLEHCLHFREAVLGPVTPIPQAR